ITPALRTSSGSSVFWGSIYLLTASTRMLNIRATAKMELPNAPTTSARRKPKVLFLCRFILLALTPSQAMIMETKWERTAKASEARERELPMLAITSSITNRRTLTAHRRTNRKLLPEYRPMAPRSRAAPHPSLGKGNSPLHGNTWLSPAFRLKPLHQLILSLEPVVFHWTCSSESPGPRACRLTLQILGLLSLRHRMSQFLLMHLSIYIHTILVFFSSGKH
uniref:Uncharacterized protein n=1 Tax=Panthera tigris altaica TaxID=74533 RepID=A0A8C9K2P3_PANTA